MIDLQSLPTSSGIYYLQNTNNNKIYIGKSVNIRKRVSRHIGELSKNKHCNPHLQCAWNIDGCDNFIAGVLELCDNELLSLKEIEYIQSFNASSMLYGYNLTDGGILNNCKHITSYSGKHLRDKLRWEFYHKEVVA